MSVTHSRDLRDAAVVELRRYTLHPGQRDVLIDLFEEHFVTGQEDAGITIGGLFRDEDHDDRFVWMRGFAGLADRTRALEAFYYGPSWRAHREAANATMIDSDDVFLLQPCRTPGSAAPPSTGAGPERVHAGVWLFEPDTELERRLGAVVHDVLEPELDVPVALWRSHPGPNGFPALPIRDDHAMVWMATFPTAADRDAALTRLRNSPPWREAMTSFAGRITVDDMRLRPTARSKHPSFSGLSRTGRSRR
jgi:NIPSNAP